MAPTAKRLESLDFVRGCALFGILLMNINGMGLGPAYDNPTIAGGATGINLWTWFFFNVGFEGTQRALFSLLFGAGVILFSTRIEATGRPDHADIYIRRQLWLVVFGLFNAWVLLWIGDILFYYGIVALILYAFRKLPGRALLCLGIGALILAAGWSAIEARALIPVHQQAMSAQQIAPAQRTEEQREAIESWQEKARDGPPPEGVAEMRKNLTSSYWSALKESAGLITYFQSWWLYRDFFDFFGMMMIGMALFKLGGLTLEARTRTSGDGAGWLRDRYPAQFVRSSLDHGPGLYQPCLRPGENNL